jgi:hypothetical protein
MIDKAKALYPKVYEQAVFQAKICYEDSEIISVIWFPHESELRIITVSNSEYTYPLEEDELISTFYFTASPKDNMLFPTRIGEIVAGDFGRDISPDRWDWNEAIRICRNNLRGSE